MTRNLVGAVFLLALAIASGSSTCGDRGALLLQQKQSLQTTELSALGRRAATRFLSWNVYYANNLRGRARQIADAIREVDPEIVSLQELWHEWDAILDELNMGSPGTWEFARGGETEKTWDGDILYRSDLWYLEESGMRAYGDRGVSWAALKRRSDGMGVIAAGTHPWCCTNDEPILRTVQDEILAVLKEQRIKRPGYPAAVMGDMNAGYYANSQYLMREGSRSAFDRDWSILPYSFRDSYAIGNNDPDTSTGTWGGGKIDFVYFEETPLQMGQIVDSKVWKNCDRAGSDHCAVSGDIILSGTAQPSSLTTTQPSFSCAPFAEWPDVDNGVTCAGCTALVLTEPYEGRCDNFCSSFGHICLGAAEEEEENCRVKYSVACDEQITGTSDMLCTCAQPSSTAEPTSTSLDASFEAVDGGVGRACRGASPNDNKASYYWKTQTSSLDECKQLCLGDLNCVGVEYGERYQRCEIWTRESGIGASAPVTGYTCLRYGGHTQQECVDGWAPALECVPSFSYNGQIYTGCTTADHDQGWCSHDSTSTSEWSNCLPCGPVEFESQEGRACRGPGGVADNKPSYYDIRSAASLDLCKQICVATPSCTGIEWGKNNRCEVWTSVIGASKVVSGYTCLRVVRD